MSSKLTEILSDLDLSKTDNIISGLGISVQNENPTIKTGEPLFSNYASLIESILAYDVEVVPWEEIHIGELLGAGHTMTVHLGDWKGQNVALKFVNAEMPINAESASFLSHQFHERLGQAALEIQVMSNESLIENPNVISLLGVTFQASNHANGAITMTPVLIVELAELEKGSPITLDKYVLGSTRTLTLAEKTDLLLGIVRGLTALHSVGITHADLKPSNILMFPGKGGLLVPKLCDFGFVRLDGFEADIDGGTLYWAAPECLPTAPDRLKMVRHRVTRDIFSFGLVMWLVVFERLPFGPQNRWDQDYVAIVKLQNGMKDLLEKEFGRSFHLRVRLPEHIDETDLDEEGKTEDKGMMTRLSDLGVLDEVRFDQRLHRWMEETSGIQHLMRRVMSICLRTNPEKRSMALSLFAKEAASKRYGSNKSKNATSDQTALATNDTSDSTLAGVSQIKGSGEMSSLAAGTTVIMNDVGAIAFQRTPFFFITPAAVRKIPPAVQQALVDHCIFCTTAKDFPDTPRYAWLLGECYYQGFGVSKDVEKSRAYFIIAAESSLDKGRKLKQLLVGEYHTKGWPTSFTVEKRVSWYLDCLLPHSRVRALPEFDYRQTMRDTIMRIASPETEKMLGSWFEGDAMLSWNNAYGSSSTYGDGSGKSTLWKKAITAIRKPDINHLRQIIDQDSSLLSPPKGHASLLHVAAANDEPAITRLLIDQYGHAQNVEDEIGDVPVVTALRLQCHRSFLVLFNPLVDVQNFKLSRLHLHNALNGTGDDLDFIRRLEIIAFAQEAEARNKKKVQIIGTNKYHRAFLEHKQGLFAEGDPAGDSGSEQPDEEEDRNSAFVEMDRVRDENQYLLQASLHLSLLRGNWSVFSAALLYGADREQRGFSSAESDARKWLGLFFAGSNPDLVMKNLSYAPIQMAAWTCKSLMLAALLASGAKVDSRGSEGRTALHMTGLPPRPYEQLDKWLKPAEGESLAKVQMIRLPFEDFAKMNRPIVLQLLLNAGAELEKKDIKGMTPLAYALEFSQLDVAEYLLDHIPPANINCTDATNRSPLHRAVDTQDEDCMKFCIKKGARLDLQDYLGYTPLELAVINQNKPFCELLLEAGAEIGALDDRRCNAIHLAIRLSNWPILGLLLDNLESSTPTKAPRTRHLAQNLGSQLGELHLGGSAPQQLEDEENQTKATHRKKVLGQYDITGMNALGMALQRPSIPDNLLSRIVSNLGSDIATLKNSMGETALHHALLFKDKPNLEHILLLLEAGADPNALDDIFGFAPMHVCAFMGFSTQALEWNYAMTLLLEQGGDQTLTEGRKGWSWKTIAEFEATWNQDGGTAWHESPTWYKHREEVQKLVLEQQTERNRRTEKATTKEKRDALRDSLRKKQRDATCAEMEDDKPPTGG